MRKTYLYLLSAFMLLSSCQQHDNTQINELKNQITLLQKRVEVLEREAIIEQLAPVRSKPGKTKTTAKKPKKKEVMGIIDLPSGDIPISSQETKITPAASTPIYDPPPAPRINYKESSYSGRCQAITKKGTQCKRTATSGSYCWQHG